MDFLQRLAGFLDRPLFPWKKMIIGFSVGQYIFESFLTLRQYRVLQKPAPPAVLSKEVSQDTFEKSNSYGRAKARFSLVSGLWSQVVNVAFIQLDILPKLWSWTGDLLLRWAPQRFSGEISHSIVFVLVFALLQEFLSMPASLYQTFVLEEAFGFNKTTPKTFVTDFIKAQAVGCAIIVPAVAGALKIIQKTGGHFVFYLWGFSALILVANMTIFPIFILPLFRKMMPLEDGELKTRVEKQAASLNFPLKELCVIDESSRSAHSNAYFTGLPWKKILVIYDTLIESQTNDEIMAVLCHELGHWKLGHVSRLFAVAQAQLLYMFSAFSVFINNRSLYSAFGFHTQQPIIIGFLLFSDALSPIDALIKPLLSSITRRYEYQADAFARDLGMRRELSSALLKLYTQNLSSMDVDWLYSFYHYSHPHLTERLKALGWKGEEHFTKAEDEKADEGVVKATGRSEL